MKPLNKKERSKAFYKVVGLFLFSLAIAVILGFVTMKSPDFAEKSANKNLNKIEEQNKFQEETFAPEIEKINNQIQTALDKKKQGENIDQELSDITASITKIKNAIPEEDDWKKSLYINLMKAYTDLRISLNEQVTLQDELDNIQNNSAGAGEELIRLRGENKKLLTDVQNLESSAASGDPQADKKLSDAQSEIKNLKQQLFECNEEKEIFDKEIKRLKKK